MRSRLAAATIMLTLVIGWVVWAAVPPIGGAVGGGVKVVALWLATGIASIGLLIDRTPLERGPLASLRLPLLAAVTAPLSLLPAMTSGSEVLVASSFALWPFSNFLLADVLAGAAPTRQAAFLLRWITFLLTVVSVDLGLVLTAVGWPEALPVTIFFIVLVGSIATLPGLAAGFVSRRVDADRLGATSTDLVTGIALAGLWNHAAGLVPGPAGTIGRISGSSCSSRGSRRSPSLPASRWARLPVSPIGRPLSVIWSWPSPSRSGHVCRAAPRRAPAEPPPPHATTGAGWRRRCGGRRAQRGRRAS